MKGPATSSRICSVSRTGSLLMLLVGAGLWPVLGQAGSVESAEVAYADGRYQLDLSMRIDSAPEVVYALVTDYARLDQISKTIIESAVLDHDAGLRRRLVTQTCVWFFCFTATLVEDVVESEPHHEIITTVVPELSDYRYGRTRWRITPDNGGTRIDFMALLEPDFWIPPLIGPWLMKQTMREEAERTVLKIEQLTR